jgi:hypothetical protein
MLGSTTDIVMVVFLDNLIAYDISVISIRFFVQNDPH